MQTERAPFLAKLKTLKPALPDKSPLEGLTNIWFDGQTATAYNDVIAIQVPMAGDLLGGILGSALIGLLEKSSGKALEIKLAPTGEAVILMSGIKAKLPVLPATGALFAFPAEEAGSPLGELTLDALNHVLIAAPSGPGDNSGVTVMPEGGALSFYSTDAKTVAWARVPLPEGYEAPRLALPVLFCEQLVSLCKKGGSWSLGELSATATASGLPARLFGKLLEQASLLDFGSVVSANWPDGAQGVELPEKLKETLDRAAVLTGGLQGVPVSVSLDGDVLRVHLRTDRGELNEAIKLKAPHEKVQGLFEPGLIRRGMDRCAHFLVTERSFCMSGKDDRGYLVSASVR